jgi:hypothetical protein
MTLPQILNGVSDDWGLAFAIIVGGLGALFNFVIFLPVQLVFTLAAKNVEVRARIAILGALIGAILVGATPSAVLDVRCYIRQGCFPADAGIGWGIALGGGIVTFTIAVLTYFLVYRNPLRNAEAPKP